MDPHVGNDSEHLRPGEEPSVTRSVSYLHHLPIERAHPVAPRRSLGRKDPREGPPTLPGSSTHQARGWVSSDRLVQLPWTC